MRLPTPTRLALCAALVVTALPTVAVAATGTPGATGVGSPSPVRPGGTAPVAPAARRAEQALAAVRAAFAGDAPRRSSSAAASPGRDLTMQMLQLHRSLHALSPADREVAQGYLARPTDGFADPDGSGYSSTARPRTDCQGKVCVTWATRTADAPPAGDSDGDGIPNQVVRTQDVGRQVWSRVVTQGGYRAPLPDQGPTQGEGPDRRFDIYLADIGRDGLYGYCNVDSVSIRTGRDAAGYCVVDDDYAEFGVNTALENLQVTVAHEFFHAVQFAYDFLEDVWFMEGTAAWIEDELFDDVNDNRQYLRQSPMSSPTTPLDFWNDDWLPYGSWIWFRYLGERFPQAAGGLPVVVRQAWRYADDADPNRRGRYSLQAVNKVIADRRTTFSKVFSDFGEANRDPDRNYQEGETYPRVRAVAAFDLTSSRRSVGPRSATMAHLTNYSIVFRPGAGLRSTSWRLRVRVDAPTLRGSYAQLAVYAADGSVRSRAIRLDASGVGASNARFDTSSVNRVELTLTNAGRRYTCHRGTRLSCEGKSRDNGVRTEFRANLFRAS